MSEELYSIKQLTDYKVFLPPLSRQHDTPEKQAKRDARFQRNRDFVKAAGIRKPQMPITGSFIYAHPPNYRGAETIHWDKREWLVNLKRLKGYGIDTVIFQASLWAELEECYYPSKVFSGFHTWNVIEPMLEAANELGLKVFLGGYGSVTCWSQRLSDNIIQEEIERQTSCFRELLQYRDGFHGFYFSPESAYTGKRAPELEKFLQELYYGFFSEIRNADSGLKILMSPATFYFPDKMADMHDAWCEIFGRARPDLLAPQDSIGCGCITLDHQVEALKIWKSITDDCGIEFWSNVECFDCCAPYYDETARCAADPDRVIVQMNNAAPLVRKLITWELLYYGNAALHPKGIPMIEKLFGVQSK